MIDEFEETENAVDAGVQAETSEQPPQESQPQSVPEAMKIAVAAGISVIPADHTNKRPAMWLLPTDAEGKAVWAPFEQNIVDVDTLETWCGTDIGAFAIVCGQVSGGLVIFDFDVPEYYYSWRKAVGSLADGLLVQKTGGGGFQVAFRCPQPGGNQKLAWALDDKEQSGRTIAIETRGDGGYAVFAPSLHPSGNLYRIIQGSLATIPSLPQEQADAFLDAARKMDQAPATKQQMMQLVKQQKTKEPGQHTDVIGAFNNSHPIEEVLKQHGYTACPGNRYIRPGGDGLSVQVLEECSFHFSTNDPLNDGRVSTVCGVHDAFDIFCHHGHNGDVKAAVKAAAEELGLMVEFSDSARNSQSAVLVKLADNAELFHCDDVPYAAITVSHDDGTSHRENHPINRRAFRMWLTREYYRAYKRAPSAQPMQDALHNLAARAMFDGPQFPVAIRLAQINNSIYLDLANERWEAVEITADGWKIVSNPPVRFIRRSGMQSLPHPVPGGSLDELRTLINAPDDATWRLDVAWLIGVCRPTGPYPVLIVNGEQGSTKSTKCRMLRRLIDPNVADLRSAPREERDVMIAASNSWILGYDNLSHISPEMSDTLCRVATGAGFGTRLLYSDDEERIFGAARPIIINGIEEMVSRPDLLDRSILTMLPSMPDTQRRSEADVWAQFEAARPRILGAILTAVSAALRNLSSIHLDHRPRMADFYEWVLAAESALPWPPGGFRAAFDQNLEEAYDSAIEGSAIGSTIISHMRHPPEWRGSLTTLLEILEKLAGDKTKKSLGWPQSAKGLANALRRLAPALKHAGVLVKFGKRTNLGTPVQLIRLAHAPSQCSPTVPASVPGDGAAMPGAASTDSLAVSSLVAKESTDQHAIAGDDGDGGDVKNPATNEQPAAEAEEVCEEPDFDKATPPPMRRQPRRPRNPPGFVAASLEPRKPGNPPGYAPPSPQKRKPRFPPGYVPAPA